MVSRYSLLKLRFNPKTLTVMVFSYLENCPWQSFDDMVPEMWRRILFSRASLGVCSLDLTWALCPVMKLESCSPVAPLIDVPDSFSSMMCNSSSASLNRLNTF